MSMLRVCLQYAYSMPRVCLEYAYSMPTVCLETNNLFPYGEQNIPTLGTKHSQPGNKTGFLRPFSSKRAELERRLVISMLLLLVLGSTSVWGQETPDYSGVYYIANAIWNGSNTSSPYYWYSENTPEYNWYLVPGANPQQGNKQDAFYSSNYSSTDGYPEKPFLTTFRTNRDNNSIWIIKKTGNYYYIIHALTGKYVKYEPPYINGVSGQTNNDNCHRKAIHLEAWTDSDNDPGDVFKYEITTNKNTTSSVTGFNIKYTGTLASGSNRHFNPAGDNWEYYYGKNDKKPYSLGMVGLWTSGSDGSITKGCLWPYEDAKDALTPTINVNAELGSFTITPPVVTYINPENTSSTITKPAGFLPPGCSIRYTTGDGTQDAPAPSTEDPSGYTGTEYTGAVEITDFSNVKAVIVGYGMVLSNVADQTVKCATPSISYANNTVTIETSTPDATIYYTSTTNGTEPDDPTTSAYTGTGSTPLVINDVTVTTKYKAIAVKEGLVNSSVASQTVVVNPTIELSSYSFVYTGSDIKPTVTINGGAIPSSEYKVTYSNNVNVGTATATITNKPGGDYYVVGGSINFEITKAPVTVTANNQTKEYGDSADPELTFTASGLLGSDTEANAFTGTLTREPGDAFGTYAISRGTLDSDNYTITSFTGATLTITAKAITITADSGEKVYDGTALTKNSYATNTALVSGDAITSITITGSQTNAGSSDNVPSGAVIKNGETDVTANYNITYANGTLTVTPKPVTITANDAEKTYDGSALTESGFTASDLEAGDTHTFTVTMTAESTITNAGSQSNVIATVDGVTVTTGNETAVGNYLVITVDGTLTVNPKPVTITANDAEKTYDGSALTESGFTASDLEAGDTHTFTVTMTAESTITNAGSQSNVIATVDGVTVTTGNETAVGNYLVITVDGTLTVNPKGVTLTANSDTREYNGEEQTVTGFTCSVEGLTFTGVSASGSGTAIGTYEVTFTGVTINTTKDDTGNYVVIGTTNGTLTIMGTNNIHITLTMNGWTYGDNPKNPSISIAEYDAKDATKTFYYKVQNAADATYKTDAPTKSTKAGTYTVKVVVEPYNQYLGGEATTDFTISKATLTIKAVAKTKDYLDPDPEFTYTVSGLKNSERQEDVLKDCNLQRVSGENVGTYNISINETTFEISPNYTRSFTEAKLTINKKHLGDGDTPAPGIGINMKDGNPQTVSVFNGQRALESTDYTYTITDNVVKITAAGNNCTGSAKATYSSVANDFFHSIDANNPQSDKIAVYTSTSDQMASADLVPCIVGQVNPTMGTLSVIPVSYIPKDVPVILLAKYDVTGMTTSPKNPNTPAISESLLNNNQLLVAPDVLSDPDNPASAHGVHVEDTEAYVFYKGEFVLTTAGTITAGKYYLKNPNYQTAASPSTSADPAPARSLAIIKGETTGIIQLINDETTDHLNEGWYTIDGQKLSKKPTRKGLYIQNGKKHIVR